MKKTIKLIFVIITLSLIALPIVFFNTKESISKKENRAFAERPKLIKDNRLNNKFFSEYDSYFQDRMGFRDQLIDLNSKIPLKLQSLNSQKALEGKNGWYFCIDPNDDNNLLDFYKRNLMAPSYLEQFKQRVSEAVEWCNEQNIKYLFVICPNKHSVYEEFYPYERPEGITRADQLIQFFESQNIPYIFSRDYLISKKADYDFPLYIETDTHWNSCGAYLSSILIRDKLSEFFPDLSFPIIDYSYSISVDYTSGDLLRMLNLPKARSTQVQMSPTGHENSDFYTYTKFLDKNGEKGVHTISTNEKLPRAFVFRDSFCIALEPFISPFFSEAEYQWKFFSSSDREDVLKFKPDIVIFEAVERNFPKIIR